MSTSPTAAAANDLFAAVHAGAEDSSPDTSPSRAEAGDDPWAVEDGEEDAEVRVVGRGAGALGSWREMRAGPPAPVLGWLCGDTLAGCSG